MVHAENTEGAKHFPKLITPPELDEVASLFEALGAGRAGKRVAVAKVAGLTAVGKVGAIAANMIGPDARPVRAILFDKRSSGNWALGWHQDRTIAVAERRDVEGFGPWTVKQGIHHVAPPTSLLLSMITARIHVDPVDEHNAPLLVAPGSHRCGLVPESGTDAKVAEGGSFACLAGAGDVWIYATLILHASARASVPRRRRVLQVDFCAEALPGGLQWATA